MMDKALLEKILPRLEEWREDGDYITEEGVLMCGRCKTPKMAYMTVPGLFENRPSPRLCKCQQEQKAQEMAAINRRNALEQIDRLRRQGLTEAQYMESTFAQDDQADERTSKVCRQYAEKWEEMKAGNMGLMLHGDVGGGKTFFASCIANALLETGTPVLMTTIPALSMAMSENFGKERAYILDQVKNIPLLILDDVGMQRNTPVAMENAYDIINTRYKAKRPLIITTNLTMKAIRDEQEVQLRRIYNRLVEMCWPVKVEGIRRREAIARKKAGQIARILNA